SGRPLRRGFARWRAALAVGALGVAVVAASLSQARNLAFRLPKPCWYVRVYVVGAPGPARIVPPRGGFSTRVRPSIGFSMRREFSLRLGEHVYQLCREF